MVFSISHCNMLRRLKELATFYGVMIQIKQLYGIQETLELLCSTTINYFNH